MPSFALAQSEPTEPPQQPPPVEEPAPAEPAPTPVDTSSALEERLRELERKNEELQEKIEFLEEDQKYVEERVEKAGAISGKVTGYLDMGFFSVQGNGTAIRSDTGTKSGPPCRVTRATKSTMAFLVAVSFHDGRGSLAFCAFARQPTTKRATTHAHTRRAAEP